VNNKRGVRVMNFLEKGINDFGEDHQVMRRIVNHSLLCSSLNAAELLAAEPCSYELNLP